MEHPARISKYELLEFLGGGMSHVYKARDTAIGRLVAVKLLTPEGANDPDAKVRFLQEARMAGNIEHENIIRIHDYGEEDGRPFIVMEFLVGEDLRHAIREGRTGDIANRIRIALDIARALEYIHSKKIIHRDIKPENIHIDASGKVKLMDFGIAKSQDLSLTKTGFVIGTPYYMAPEQVRGEKPTEQADIYAFGILLYELLTGRKAWEGDTLERLFYAILNEPLNAEPLSQAGAPQPVVDLVVRCIAKQAVDRPQSFAEVILVLERLRQTEPEGKPAQPRRRSMAVIATGVIGLVAAGIGTYFLLASKESRKPEPAPASVAAVPKPPAPTLSTSTGEMLLVPAGPFLSGPDKRSATVRAFYIDRTEVPNAAYRQFCQAKGRPLPPGFPENRPDDPVVNITFLDAQEFSKWAGKRLPTSLEWEKAARGHDGRIYPWGNQAEASRANVSDNAAAARKAMPVSSFEAGASPFKALNMTGNVWEFVDELKTPSDQAVQSFARILKPPPAAAEAWYLIRGGAFDRPLADGVVYEWTSVPARLAAPDIGFRCVKDPE